MRTQHHAACARRDSSFVVESMCVLKFSLPYMEILGTRVRRVDQRLAARPYLRASRAYCGVSNAQNARAWSSLELDPV